MKNFINLKDVPSSDLRKILFDAEIQLKVNANLNNNTLIKNLIVDLYQKASSTS